MSLPDNTVRPVQIVSGSSTTVFTGPNTFTLTLPRSGFQSNKDEVALKSLTCYYSWFNVSADKQNNSFSYNWQGTNFPVVIADGIWQFNEIMNYFQQVMEKNGHFLVDSDGVNQYYIEFIVNPQLYCLSLTATPVPTSVPAGWSNPQGISLSGQTPQLVVSSVGFASLTGFIQGTYPASAQTTLYQINSTIPQITDVSSINILCNLVDNSGFNLSPNVLTAFVVPSGQKPGSLITLQPFSPDYVPIKKDQTFETIQVSIVDQLMRPINIRDPVGFVMILNLRRRS